MWVHFQFNGFPDESVHDPVFTERNFVSCRLSVKTRVFVSVGTDIKRRYIHNTARILDVPSDVVLTVHRR